MELKNLREKVTAENRKHLQEDFDALLFTGEKNYIQKNMFSHYLTSLMNKRFEAGNLPLDTAILKARKALLLDYDKRLAMVLAKIEAVESVEFADTITISVAWKKNSAWGMNPTATAEARGSHYESATGTASGCGYDKESASVASALNQCPSIMKILYSRLESELEKNSTIMHAKEIFPYGSGYTVLPYFEGGVGIECFCTIFEFCGYEWQRSGSGKNFDCYMVTKKEGVK